MLLATQLQVNGPWVVAVARCDGEGLGFGAGVDLLEYPSAEPGALPKRPE